MTSIITGDIINSRSADSGKWMEALKERLFKMGNTPKDWEIYRGDSFQVEIPNPEDSLWKAIQIKASIKQFKNLDVRMCIGIGTKEYDTEKIAESNGEAFILSGSGFEKLKKNKQTLSVVSPEHTFDEEMNLIFSLMTAIMDNWTPSSAEYVIMSEGLLQAQVAKLLGITQASVSERHRRSYLSEIKETEKWFRKKVQAYNLNS